MSNEATGGPSCAWCSTVSPPEAATCTSCGATLAQRDALGDVAIPGVTSVDPALQAVGDRPIRLRGPSPTHGIADGIIAAAVIGGPVGLAALGGIAAVAATEVAGARRDDAGAPESVEDVGRVGPVARLAIERLERLERGEPGEPGHDAVTSDPWRDEPGRRSD